MRSASARRLIALAHVNSSPAELWPQALLHNERTVSTFSVHEPGGDGKQDKTFEPASSKGSHKISNFGISRPPSLRSPQSSILGKSEPHSYGLYQEGGANRAASLNSARLGQADDIRATRISQDNHCKYGTNASVANSESVGPPIETDLPRPDAGSSNVGVRSQVPSNSTFSADNHMLQDNILQQHNNTSHAQLYHVSKARIHATLWQQELRKQAGDLEGTADLSNDPLMSTSDTRNRNETSGWDANKTALEDWETFDPPKGEIYDESLAQEEALMFEEFEKRRERNRIQIASFVKQHLYGRRRPVDGWKYIINNFGADSKFAKGSALGGKQTTGNDLEKLALKRESGRLRRKT